MIPHDTVQIHRSTSPPDIFHPAPDVFTDGRIVASFLSRRGSRKLNSAPRVGADVLLSSLRYISPRPIPSVYKSKSLYMAFQHTITAWSTMQ